MAEPLVSGEIHFAVRPSLPSGAVARVRLLDTSRADAAARVVAEQILEDVAERANRGEALTFSIDGELDDERARYTISVHVDADADGRISPGDFITMQSYPVLTFGYPSRVSVEVRRVG